ncbi:MAG: hypothetical protein V1898_00535 [Patescibacteria group bacterium]
MTSEKQWKEALQLRRYSEEDFLWIKKYCNEIPTNELLDFYYHNMVMHPAIMFPGLWYADPEYKMVRTLHYCVFEFENPMGALISGHELPSGPHWSEGYLDEAECFWRYNRWISRESWRHTNFSINILNKISSILIILN